MKIKYLITPTQGLRAAFVIASCFIFSACGGGGGGGTSTLQCSTAAYAPSLSYPASLHGTSGTAISALAPTTNLPAACANSAAFTIVGTLPAGLALNASTGAITGVPSAAGSTVFNVTLSLANYASVTSNNIIASIAAAPPVTSKAWTLLVYIAGDNSLAEFAVDDLNELKAAATNANVNVVVQIEKGSLYANSISGNPGASTYRGVINGANTALADIGNQDMGNPATLSSFISWGKTNYPASNYGVVLWSHGGGWKSNKNYRGAFASTRGALADDSSGTFMSLADIKTALTNGMGVGNKISVLAFDACLMAQYEVAYQLRGVANYLLASEELVPGPGLPYTNVVNILSSTPSSSPATFASSMALAFKASYVSFANEATTMSVTDLSKLDDVHAKVLDFATAAQAGSSAQFGVLNAGRVSALTYGGTGSQSDSIDLWRYADYVATNDTANSALAIAAAALKTAISTAVVSNQSTNASMANSKGMAIYFPYNSNAYTQTSYTNSVLSNTAVAGKKTWAEFLTAIYPTTNSTDVTVVGNFSYYITWTNPPGIKVDVDLAVNEPRGNWAAPWIGSTSPNGYLSGDSTYSGQNFESYTAAPLVEKDNYDVFANLYGCTTTAGGAVADSSCTTVVTMCQKLAPATAFTCDAGTRFDLSNTLGATFYSDTGTYWPTVISASNPYYDWFYYGRTTRSLNVNKTHRNGNKLRPLKPTGR